MASIKILKLKIIRILRATERYTKTDMVYLARGSFWSLLSQGIGSLSSFVVVLLLANILSVESFGEYRFILSIISMLIICTLPGIDTSLLRSVARGCRPNIVDIIKTKIKFSFYGSLIALVMAVYYFYHGHNELVFALVLSAMFLPLIETFAVYSAYLKGKQDFKTPAIYESISRIFQALIIIIVALITKNILMILLAYFVGQTIARFFFYKKTMQNAGIENILQTVDQADDTIEYGKHLSLTQVISTIAANIDKVIVWHFLGAEALAVYYIALTIPKNIVLFCNIIPRIALPKFSQNSWEAHERTKVLRKLYIFLSVLIIPALLYYIFIPIAIPILFKAYSASIPAALWLTLLIILSPVNALVGQILQAQKAVQKIIILQVISLMIFVVVFLCMHYALGVTAVTAAVALVVSECVTFLCGILFVKYTSINRLNPSLFLKK